MAKSKLENFLFSVGRVISYPFRLIGSAFKAFVNWILPNTFKDKAVEPVEREVPVMPVPPVVMRVGGSDSQPMPKPADPQGVLTVPVTHPQHFMPPDSNKYPEEVFNPDSVELGDIPDGLRPLAGQGERLYQAMMKQYIILSKQENRQLFCTENARRAPSYYTLDGAPVPDNIAKAEVRIDQQVLEDFRDNAKLSPPKTLFAYPVRLSECHWVLLVIDREQRTVEYYDSLRDFNKEKVQAHFTKLADMLTKIEPGTPYKAEFKIKKQIQNDGFNCGAWALYFLQHRLFNKEIDFNNLPYIPQMKNYRKVLLRALMRGSIKEPDESKPRP